MTRHRDDWIWQHEPRDYEFIRYPPDIRASDPAYNQLNFRVRDDSAGLNVDSGWLALENTNPPARGTGTTNRFRVRFTVDETDNRSGTATTFNVKFSYKGGGYQTITGATLVRVTGGVPADGDDCSTQLLGSAATGSFEGDGEYAETDARFDAWAHDKNNFAEFEICLYIVDASVSDGDTIALQVFGQNENTATPFDTYTNTPTITVSKPAGHVMPNTTVLLQSVKTGAFW